MFTFTRINFFDATLKVLLLILLSNIGSVKSAWSNDFKLQPMLVTESEEQLTEIEQEILQEINRARTAPEEYGEWLESLKQYYVDGVLKLPGESEIRTNRGLQTLEEAIIFVKEQSPLEPLTTTEDLATSAEQRVTEFTSNRQNRNLDNISYGKVTSEAIVMQLIVDDRFPDRRHRLAIFNPNYQDTGVACQNDPRYTQVCAIAYEVESDDLVTENPTTESEDNSQPTVIVPNATVINEQPEAESNNEESESDTAPASPSSILIEKTERGILEPGDKTIPNDGSLYDSYPLEGKAGDSFVISLESQEFDTFLAIMDQEGNIIEQNDDISDQNSNSRLRVTLPDDGTYNVIVNAYDQGGKGRYVLTVRR